MDYGKECLYDVEWQCLRVSLLSKSGTQEWTEALKQYVSSGDWDRGERVWRVVNLCNATLLAYGSRDVGEQRAIVEAMRQWCYEQHVSFASLEAWDWLKVEGDLRELYVKDRGMFNAVKQNLQKRVKTSQYKARKRGEVDNADGFKHRTELQHFLQLMADAESDVEWMAYEAALLEAGDD